MYKKIDGKYYKEINLEDLSKEDLIELIDDLNSPRVIPYNPNNDLLSENHPHSRNRINVLYHN